MSSGPSVLQHLGAYSEHGPVSAFGSISDRAWALYKEASGGDVRSDETPTQHLVTRMMYVAEVTSVAMRLNASWALTHPALSLVRDRYEQAVRFSWLARQDGALQMTRYVASYYAKVLKLNASMSDIEKKEFKKLWSEGDEWIEAELTKEQLTSLNRWNELDLKSMVEKRDKLPPLSDCDVAKEKLADFYMPVYSQFSSVTHYDMYSMRILGLHKAPSGQLVLAADPHLPGLINLFNSLFDLIQCFEATRKYSEKDFDCRFSPLLKEWKGYMRRVVGLPEKKPE